MNRLVFPELPRHDWLLKAFSLGRRRRAARRMRGTNAARDIVTIAV